MFARGYEKGIIQRYGDLVDVSNDQHWYGVRGEVIEMYRPIVCEECELAFGGKDASLAYNMSSS